MKRKPKYRRRESSKKELLRTVRYLIRKNIELANELHPWREFKAALLAQTKRENDE